MLAQATRLGKAVTHTLGSILEIISLGHDATQIHLAGSNLRSISLEPAHLVTRVDEGSMIILVERPTGFADVDYLAWKKSLSSTIEAVVSTRDYSTCLTGLQFRRSGKELFFDAVLLRPR
ncbi:hypothetical protein B7Y94_02690 [Candidatus Saccharibacteria bacterium 32-49-12]|nr:MAG: hypothetical protein B7Y94_02690 [Candidatus Saccharibacteria bacterium 32-49-12]